MPRQSQRVVRNKIAAPPHIVNSSSQVDNTCPDYSSMSVFEILSLVLAKNTDPEINGMLQAIVGKLPQFVKEVAKEEAKDVYATEEREHSLIFAGVPEAPQNLKVSEKLADLDKKISNIFDILEVESYPKAAFRMGKFSSSRPRLVKVILYSRSQWITALSNAYRLRSTEFKTVFVRKSMSLEERRHEFDLRQEAKKRNAELNAKIWVVYKGELIKADNIPKLKEQHRTGNVQVMNPRPNS
ncbi:unnamed protein product [Nippostrongylus brasiliensis]|uniref:Uncharacterized protein n=1 Tax=Nippostrongylus brasiliensis TaxID=27835 RepID=A0A0N4YIY9_NIPBR|nr:unnamed protein product [Nippostrongylus brasiliensis]